MAKPKQPEIVSHLINHLTSKGVADARETAIERLQEYGILRKGSETTLTAHGKRRDAMGHAGRAKDRAAQRSANHKPSDYKISGGRAILK